MFVLRAEKIDYLIRDMEETRGKVHSVFNRVVNLLFGNEFFVSILNEEMYMVPFGIKVNKKGSFPDGLKECEVVREGDSILVYDGALRLKVVWDNTAYVWDGSLPLIVWDDDVCRKRMKDVSSFLYSNGRGKLYRILFDGSYDSFAERTFGLIRDFFYTIEKGGDTKEAVKKILGYGEGLTPSLDDWLSGFSSVFWVFGKKVDWLEGIKEVALKTTTTVSAYMLHNYSLGFATELHKDFWMFFERGGHAFYDSVFKVSEIGATSGTDWLTGVVMGLDFICKRGEVSCQ